MYFIFYLVHPRLLLGVIILLILIACSEEEPYDSAGEGIEGAWVANSPYKWEHDGHPCFSRYCIVFSDSATMEMKETAGKFADSRFQWIMQQFNFTSPGEFLFPQGNDKIHIYLNLTHEERIAAAFWGTVIFSFPQQAIDTSCLDYLFRHELTHAFEYLIEGTVELGTDVWFREGMAIYMAGGMHVIRDTAGLNQWISRNSGFPNAGNPISISGWEDFPEGSDITGYYTVFDIVMMYILDENGLNNELSDILSIFYDVRNGIPFESAFQERIGISLTEFEGSVFERLGKYLPGSS
jgi:hypothetical protein